MASIKLGAIVADIKGKLAGNYFAKRKNTTVLAVCGSKLTKADAGRTTLQKSRNTLFQVSRTWKDITDAQRTLWDNAAALLTWYTKVGIAYTPSGYQFYTQCNINRVNIDQSVIDEPVTPAAPHDVNRCDVEITTGGVLTYTYAGSAPTGKSVIISATYTNSLGVKYAKGGYKRIALMDAGETGPVVITANYVNVFGIAPTSGRVFFKFDMIDKDSGIQEGSKLTKADAGLV